MSTEAPSDRMNVLEERLRILQQRDSLEQERRVKDIKFSRLAELTRIPYKRLWRYFRDDGSLEADELERLRVVLLPTEARS